VCAIAHQIEADMSSSAFLGQPPASQDDFYTIKGMYRAAYAFNKDASRGYLFVPKRPENYVYNDKQAGIIIGLVAAIVIMLSTTILRLALRQFKTGVRWGADDWILIPGVVWGNVLPSQQIPHSLMCKRRSWLRYIRYCK
jgi:hypothetical protein